MGYHVWDIPLVDDSPEPLDTVPDELRAHSTFFTSPTSNAASVLSYKLDLGSKNTAALEGAPIPVYGSRYKPVTK
jgi:hypothetical protein